jgi:mannose-6-phosphate isomerase-like protein (cupin superfamily)
MTVQFRYNPNLGAACDLGSVKKGRSVVRQIGVVFLALAGFALAAGDPPGFALWTSSDLKGYEQQLIQKLGPQKAATQQFNDFGTHLVMMAHRQTDGEAEIHETNSDVFVVESGEATLVVGGNVVGARSTGPGEVRGKSIEGGVAKRIAAGDIVNIPPHTPHQTLVRAGQRVTYLVVKVKTK